MIHLLECSILETSPEFAGKCVSRLSVYTPPGPDSSTTGPTSLTILTVL